MANQILAGAVFQAGQVIAGVDANNPPYVGPPVAKWITRSISGSPRTLYIRSVMDLDAEPTTLTNTASTFGVNHNMAVHPSGRYIAVPDHKGYSGGDPVVFVYDTQDLSAPLATLSPDAGEATYGGSPYQFGYSMAMSDTKLFVGNDAQGVPVYCYDLSDLSAAPSKISTPTTYHNGDYKFSSDMAVNSTHLFIGHSACRNPLTSNDNQTEAGAVHVYDATTLQYQTTLYGLEGEHSDFFGSEVKATDTHLAVGAYGDDEANGTQNQNGAVYVFDATDLTATATKVMPLTSGHSDAFGRFISLSDTHLAVSEYEDSTNNNGSGALHIYDLNNLSNPSISYGTLYSEYYGSNPHLFNDGSNRISFYRSFANLGQPAKYFVYNISDLTTPLWESETEMPYAFLPAYVAPPPPPPVPTFERVLFRSRAQSSQNYARSVSILDPVTMVSTPLPDPTGVIEGSFGSSMASTPDGSLIAFGSSNDYNGQSGADNIVEWGAIHIYDATNLSAGPTHTIRHHQDEGISGRGRNLGSALLMTNTHLYVGIPSWYAGPYISDWHQRNAVTEGRVFKYDLSDLSAAPVTIESPKLPTSNINKDGNPSAVNFGDRMFAFGDKIFVLAVSDLTNQTVVNNRQGQGGLYVYDADNFATGQHTQYLTQDGWYGFGFDMFNDGDDLWILSPQPQVGIDHYTFDYGQLWKYSLADLSAAPTLSVNPQDFRGSDGGSNWDNFGQKVVFTDTKIIISSAHEYEDWPSEGGYKGYIYIMNKDGSQKQILTNLPPNHAEEWTVFGRYMQLVAGKLLISRYSPYGQDTAPGGAYPDGNGELWIYDPENLGAAPVLWDEAGTINANEEVIDSEMVVMNLQLPE